MCHLGCPFVISTLWRDLEIPPFRCRYSPLRSSFSEASRNDRWELVKITEGKRENDRKGKSKGTKGPNSKSELPALDAPHRVGVGLGEGGRVAAIEIQGPGVRGGVLGGGPIVGGTKIISEAHSVGIDTL